jgi:Cys-tRNA(Pro)/Cys-tRNA(Cys) deacylase
MARTRAIAVAEQGRVPFRLFEYEHDPGSRSFGLEAAEKLGVDPARVFKTLVVEIDGKAAVAIVPVQAELDLRALGKRAAIAKPVDAERVTGYVTGGISPLGLRKQLPTLLDESAVAFETVYVSAGRRGLELEIAPRDLLRLTGGKARPIAARR